MKTTVLLLSFFLFSMAVYEVNAGAAKGKSRREKIPFLMKNESHLLEAFYAFFYSTEIRDPEEPLSPELEVARKARLQEMSDLLNETVRYHSSEGICDLHQSPTRDRHEQMEIIRRQTLLRQGEGENIDQKEEVLKNKAWDQLNRNFFAKGHKGRTFRLMTDYLTGRRIDSKDTHFRRDQGKAGKGRFSGCSQCEDCRTKVFILLDKRYPGSQRNLQTRGR